MSIDYRMVSISCVENKNEYKVSWHERKPSDRWRIKSCMGKSGSREPSEIVIDVLAENDLIEAIPELARKTKENNVQVYNYAYWGRVLKP